MIGSRFLAVAALVATATAHATWQQLWINGKDYGGSCVRRANDNNPVSVGSSNMNCNAAQSSAPNTCTISAGDTLEVEMHQQPGQRSCGTLAIGGNHYGPIMIYLGKVANASTASPSSVSWFKIAEHGLMSNNPDYFANTVMEDNCGHYKFKVPSDIAAGQYLLRAETIALHSASGSGGAQFYIGCYQLQINGGGSATPSGVSFPGAYSANDPGILINIHMGLDTYVIPGPSPYGTNRPSVATTSWPRTPTINTGGLPQNDFTTLPGGSQTTTSGGSSSSTSSTSSSSPTTTSSSSGGGGTVPLYGQCGGQGWTGGTTCASGTCKYSNQWYSQCLP